MLDTVKLAIPITEKQHAKIKAFADKADCWQWILHNSATGEILFRRTKGLALTDSQSFHRQLRWDIPHEYSTDARLMLEFSLPKYWYGHNIHLLYDFLEPLRWLKASLEKQFGLKASGRLPAIEVWQLLRLDVCYAWRFPSQRLAQSFLDSLKHLHFPWKKPTYYPTAILFAGKTYSVKFYLKLPEFRTHDRKEMLKSNAALEWVNHCEAIADGVLRFEATLRQKYLRRQKIVTVGDLTRSVEYVEWLESSPPDNDLLRAIIFMKVLGDYMQSQIPSDPKEAVPFLLSQIERGGDAINLKTGTNIQFDGFRLNEIHKSSISGLVSELPPDLRNFEVEPGCVGYRIEDKLTSISRRLLIKFIGENACMQRIDEIETKLMQVYKPVKAARLVSFWLYVQRFGSVKAKDVFGKRSYYYTKGELKKAGISLIEPPSGNNITVLDKDFMQQFRLEIPSQFVTNKFDDFRNSSNVLNFVPKVSGLDG